MVEKQDSFESHHYQDYAYLSNNYIHLSNPLLVPLLTIVKFLLTAYLIVLCYKLFVCVCFFPISAYFALFNVPLLLMLFSFVSKSDLLIKTATSGILLSISVSFVISFSN